MIRPLRLYNLFFTVLTFSFLSCNEDKKEAITAQEAGNIPVSEPPQSAVEYELKTFESKDESGKIQGWGYDIYINGSRTIHQPTIPAVSGIHYFKTEEEALKVGEYATSKMRTSGSFPTLSIEELDSLGVITK
jgi:hypothetical protein